MFSNLVDKLFSRVVPGNRKRQFGKNVLIGNNTDITGSIDQSRAPNSKVIIGNDCMICGNISLETNDAILEIGNNVFFGPGSSIVCTNKITIESDILISADCLIQDSDNHSTNFEIRKLDVADWKRGYHDWSKHPSIPIKISRGAWLGAKVIVLKGVTIGNKSIVGAGSVVTKSTPDDSIFAGNPATFIKKVTE
jgi:acetyltransferase-like isoleucine patch superfamily enzyme